MTDLIHYESARQAIALCASVDEAKDIKDKAQALAAYARLAKDTELEEHSVEIRERARIRLGEMTAALPKVAPAESGGMAKGLPVQGKTYAKQAALEKAGISTSEASRLEQLAKKSEPEQEKHIENRKAAVRKRHDRERTHFSGGSGESDPRDHWRTPEWIVERVMAAMGDIDLDPCADSGLEIPAANHITAGGLDLPWGGRVYCNPPYSQAEKWVDKFLSEPIEQGCLLVPARPGSKWFQMLSPCLMAFLHGRVIFVGADNTAPFPSAIFYRGNQPRQFISQFRDCAQIWKAA